MVGHFKKMKSEVEYRRIKDLDREGNSLFGIPVPSRPESKIPITKSNSAEMLRLENYTLPDIKAEIAKAIISPTGFPETVLRLVEPDLKASSEDYGVACHLLAPKLRMPPVQIAQNLASDLLKQG